MKILIPSQKYTTYIQLHTHTHTHLIITSYNDTRRVCIKNIYKIYKGFVNEIFMKIKFISFKLKSPPYVCVYWISFCSSESNFYFVSQVFLQYQNISNFIYYFITHIWIIISQKFFNAFFGQKWEILNIWLKKLEEEN